jgi:ankyrin repeat protein
MFGLTALLRAQLPQCDHEIKDSGGRTPLSWAVVNVHTGTIELLLAIDGVEVDSEDNSG